MEKHPATSDIPIIHPRTYTLNQLLRVANAYENYMRDSFSDDDTWIIELIQKKDFNNLDKAFARGI